MPTTTTDRLGRTVVELERRTYLGRARGFHNAGDGRTVIGPIVVDVVVTQTLEEGRDLWPSYAVLFDGEHRFGGFAHHLDDDGLPPTLARQVDVGRLVATAGR
jgi:hypothetical protein